MIWGVLQCRAYSIRFVSAMRVFTSICLLLTMGWAFGQFGDEALMKQESLAFHMKQSMLSKRSGQRYDIVYHKLVLEADPAVRSIKGSVLSYFKTLESNFSQIAFDLSDTMVVDSVVYHSKPVGFTHQNHELLIDIDVLGMNVLDSVTVYYHGDPSRYPQGAFSYDNHHTGPVLWTLSEPYGALGWWPCKQQLEDKIDSFDMSVKVPEGNKVAGLGLLQKVDTLPSKELIYHWKTRYPLATYLVAVAVTNYEEFTHYAYFWDGDSLPILEYMYPQYLAIAKTEALKVEEMLRVFDSLLGPYPFRSEKYGHAQWGRGGGMEHQTMSFMSDLNFDLVAHELAHQWYGDKITCGSWQDIWLNEGFATYLVAIAHEFINSKPEFLAYLDKNRVRATNETSGSVFVDDTTNFARIFSGRLSYSKGAYVLHMLRWEIGDSAFFEGLRNYTASASLCYDFARTSDLQFYMEESSGKSLDQFFDLWIYKEGFPFLDVLWKREQPHYLTLSISQIPSHSSVSYFPLKIPIRVIGSGGQDTTVIVNMDGLDHSQVYYLGFKAVSIEVDPDLWLLTKITTREGSHTDLGSIAVYPNPGSGSLEVYFRDRKIDFVEIYNPLGSLVYESSMEGRMNESVSFQHNLGPGFYFIRVVSGEEEVVSRFLVN